MGDFAYWIMQAFVHGSWLDSYFVNDYTDTGMDYFNMFALLSDENPYRLQAGYPAMCFLILKILYCFIPRELPTGDGHYYRGLMHAQILYIMCVMALVILVWELIKYSYKGNQIDKILLAVGIIFSGPFLHVLERGNIILLSIVCLLVFILFYDSEEKKKRWFAYFALAISAAIKIYPAVFGMLIVYKKRYKEAVWTAVMGLLIFLAPFFAFDGVYSMWLWLQGMSAMTDLESTHGIGYNFSFLNFIKIVCSLGGKTIQTAGILGWGIPIAVCCIIFILGKEEWKKIYALSLLCIWLPQFSYTYTLLLFILPLLYCLKDCKKSFHFFSYIYRILFLVILVPLCLPKMRYLGYGTKFPLTMPTLVINITICLLTVLILTECMIGYLQKYAKYKNRKR